MKRHWRKLYFFFAIALGAILATTLAMAQQTPASLGGQVIGAGEPIANSTVTCATATHGQGADLLKEFCRVGWQSITQLSNTQISNTVQLSTPAPNLGGVRFVKVPQSWGILGAE